MIVLAYLQDDSKRYQGFVVNRVAKIRSHSESSQWRHVPSEHNAADLASRGTLSVAHLASSEWFNGPNFLTQQDIEWPFCEQSRWSKAKYYSPRGRGKHAKSDR